MVPQETNGHDGSITQTGQLDEGYENDFGANCKSIPAETTIKFLANSSSSHFLWFSNNCDASQSILTSTAPHGLVAPSSGNCEW